MLARVPVGPVEAARAILDAGARIVQFRHKRHFSRAVFEAAEQIAELCGTAGALFVVNDRVDIAMMLHACVHLGQDDLCPADARRLIGKTAVIGFSTHNEAQIRAAAGEPVDYLALGPLFGTTTKEHPDPTVGLDELQRLRQLVTKPLVAIGGITRANALSAFEAGADSVAVIGDLLAGCERAADIGKRTEEWLQLTGSLARVS
jgi:thiamine-phosphate pyrophosphorylase